ncbi:hypothetical protein GCM10025874_21320 [Arenivirga flava]|uniref:Uncharacterized protein n=1 Tax=Arenivirga flava TaxID=1930060 RepID=A0AA37UHD1_9MICO|nr:hypothetical protein GCM10025874_21320 [Arenivirga flava]
MQADSVNRMSFGFPWFALVIYVVVPVLTASLAYVAIRFGVHHGMRSALRDADHRRLLERLELEEPPGDDAPPAP